MILIRKADLTLEAVLRSIVTATHTEALDGQYVVEATVAAGPEQQPVLVPGGILEAGGQLFDLVSVRQRHSAEGLAVDLQGEHVSYRLLADELEWFTYHGTATGALTQALSGTPCSVGTVEPTGTQTVSIQEPRSRRAILQEIARLWAGELEFDRFTIHLRTQRGREFGPELRAGKNLAGVTREVDLQEGHLRLAYAVEIADLAALPEYAEAWEQIELGDRVRVVDPALGINEQVRVVVCTRDLVRGVTSRVVLSNRLRDLVDPIFRIQQDAVLKGALYNGIRIGPANGFEAVRSDRRARAVMNATQGIRIQRGDGSGGNWEDQIHLDPDGNAVFRGQTSDGHTRIIASGVQVLDGAAQPRVHLGQFAAGRFGLRVTGANAEVALDEFGLSPAFIKRFPNKIMNSGFEHYEAQADSTAQYPGLPLYWTGGVVTSWANWEGDVALELAAGGTAEQGMQDAATHAGADPDWWQAMQTRVSFHQRGAAVRVWVRKVSDSSDYTLTDNSGDVPVTGSFLDYPAASNWEDGHRTFFFQPTPGAGRVKVRFQNIGTGALLWIDAVQIEPDFTGRWPSFYTPGPRSLPRTDVPPFEEMLQDFADWHWTLTHRVDSVSVLDHATAVIL